jgi:hypothetical protein
MQYICCPRVKIITITTVPATVWLVAKSLHHRYDRGSVSSIHFDIATLEYIKSEENTETLRRTGKDGGAARRGWYTKY